MKARGILVYLLSKPDKWRTSAQAIADDCDRDGRDSIASGLKELEELGYVARMKRRAEHGRFVWCWIYSDDPAEVAELRDQIFPDGTPAIPRRGRARATIPDTEPAGQATTGNPVYGPHAASEPPGHAMNGFSVDGPAVDGPAVDGEPVDIEREERENYPPNPPHGGGNAVPPEERCTAHGRARCRPCGLSPRVQASRERERQAAALAERERIGRACPMCKADGQAREGGTRWIRVTPGTPYVIQPVRLCDHVTPHDQVLQEIAAEEEAAEQTLRKPEQQTAPVSRAGTGSAVARAALEKARRRRSPRGDRGHHEASARPSDLRRHEHDGHTGAHAGRAPGEVA